MRDLVQEMRQGIRTGKIPFSSAYDTTHTTVAFIPFEEDDAEVLCKKLESAKAFTETYKKYINEHLAIREAMCLKEQYPALCRGIKEYDLFAGRMHNGPLVAFGIELYANGSVEAIAKDDRPESEVSDETRKLRTLLGNSQCGFFFDYATMKAISSSLPEDSDEKKEIDEIIAFWCKESTRAKYNRALPQDILDNMGKSEIDNRYVSGFFRISCQSVDFDTLLRRGIPGMKSHVSEKMKEAKQTNGDAKLYEGMLIALDVLIDVCNYYQNLAREEAKSAVSATRKEQLIKMAEALYNITTDKPRNLREAIQLFWLYNVLTGTLNYGRMDIYLGDFYVHDIDNGIITEAEAIELLKSIWRIISELRYDGMENARANTRIIIGGRGRRNEANADRFALAAMETTRLMKVAEPNLTLRFYKGQNSMLMDKAIDLFAEGCVHPGLYNDDVNIPWAQKAYNVPVEDAEHYIPEGCGEIALDHRSIGSPNTVIKYTCALDFVLHNGYDTTTGEKRGLSFGDLKSFDTFEILYDAVKKQIDFTNEISARRHAIEYEIEAEAATFLYMSMLTDDCIAKGRALFDGGARYLGGIIETFGLTNLSDSLLVIKKLVYEDKMMTLEKLVEIVDANFEGYERERQIMLRVPKFGNDNDEADTLHTELSNYVCRSVYEKAEAEGLHFFLNVNLNTGGIRYGVNTKATADGRYFGEAFAVGNAPTAGRDVSGITAVLNSMAKHEKLHAGYVHNIKVSKNMLLNENRSNFIALMDTYFDNGGCQLMITSLNRDDLENALVEPEKYTNLLVRVGGWTSKFIELPKHYQMEILNRTMYY